MAALLFLVGDLLPASSQTAATPHVQLWLTNADRSALLAPQPPIPLQPSAAAGAAPVITVDDNRPLQPIDGFGFAMTGGSAQLLMRMDPAARHALLQNIFGRGAGEAGVSYLRVSIGASDMNDHVFTYDDRPSGETDPTLAHFSLAEDVKDVIPVLREVLAIAPALQILASPWSAPSWMKTNDLPKGGTLKPENYAVYARYLLRYLEAMQARGIRITAITMQNEPLNDHNTPSMVLEASQEEALLRDHLGPALQRAGLATKVILFDHNCDRADYPMAILNDPKARAFADGAGFHLYAGDISAMSEVHRAFPDSNLYFTEQMVVEHTVDGAFEPVAVPVSRVLIGAMRNWSRNVLLWNLAADPSFGPHTDDGGCPVCQGALTLDGNKVEENIAFYIIEHASRFVSPGSRRLESSEPDPELANVAWRTPQGQHVLLVANTGRELKRFNVDIDHRNTFAASLGPGAVGTFVW